MNVARFIAYSYMHAYLSMVSHELAYISIADQMTTEVPMHMHVIIFDIPFVAVH